jgi:hypothetical protein
VKREALNYWPPQAARKRTKGVVREQVLSSGSTPGFWHRYLIYAPCLKARISTSFSVPERGNKSDTDRGSVLKALTVS